MYEKWVENFCISVTGVNDGKNKICEIKISMKKKQKFQQQQRQGYGCVYEVDMRNRHFH